jgi:hypothetical protein
MTRGIADSLAHIEAAIDTADLLVIARRTGLVHRMVLASHPVADSIAYGFPISLYARVSSSPPEGPPYDERQIMEL